MEKPKYGKTGKESKYIPYHPSPYLYSYGWATIMGLQRTEREISRDFVYKEGRTIRYTGQAVSWAVQGE